MSCNVGQYINELVARAGLSQADVARKMMEAMLRRIKFRDYYDIYCILQEGYSIHKDIEKTLTLSRHRLSSKNIIAMLPGGQFIANNNFATMEPKYNVTKEQIRNYILHRLKE